VSLERGLGGSEPHRHEPIHRLASYDLERRAASRVLAVGTLACPSCDAPVLPDRPLSPADPLRCPVCDHAGRTREFLSLGEPTRPARVVVRLRAGGRGPEVDAARG
jgi:hypothetical protein